MKVWTKVLITDKNKDVDQIARSLTNYLYGYGPILDICRKYKITRKDRRTLDQYTANRIAGLLMLYLSKDTKRINDIINKYDLPVINCSDIIPQIEGYINK